MPANSFAARKGHF